LLRKAAAIAKRQSSRSAVSEVIGDILILAITVVLFTSVFFFVNAIPTPSAQTYANFQASLSPSVVGKSTLNITHVGGQSLNAYTTEIVVQVNQSVEVFQMQLGNTYVNGKILHWNSSTWALNQIWSVNLTGVYPSTVVTVSIINRASNSLVWSTVLSAQTGIMSPLIEVAYASPNPTPPGSKIMVYAKVAGNSKLQVDALLHYVNPQLTTVSLSYNSSNGLYQYGPVQISNQLNFGSSYPILINTSGPRGLSSNYTISLLIQSVGPDIVTASINPNPITPGSKFNVTAYVIDTNSSAFNPNTAGNVTIRPYFGPSLTSITGKELMNRTSYQGIFSISGKVNNSVTGFETFIINATDSLGYYSTYQVTLVVLSSLSPSGNLNTSYPSKYFGPTSMSFSDFSWDTPPTGPIPTYNKGYEIPASDVGSNGPGPGGNGPGVYFNVVFENHNTSSDLYVNDLSQIFFAFASISQGKSSKAVYAMSFIVQNQTQGATWWSVAPGSTTNSPKYTQHVWNKQTNPRYPVLGSSYLLLPAAVGGVALDTNISFGTSNNNNPGPFTTDVFSNPAYGLTLPAVSADYILLFGYLVPAGTQVTAPGFNFNNAIPYGQSLPFTAIYWY